MNYALFFSIILSICLLNELNFFYNLQIFCQFVDLFIQIFLSIEIIQRIIRFSVDVIIDKYLNIDRVGENVEIHKNQMNTF